MWFVGVVCSEPDARFAGAVRRLVAGGAPFVPLDARLPVARLAAMCAQLAMPHVLADTGAAGVLAQLGFVRDDGADADADGLTPYRGDAPAGAVQPGDVRAVPTAYVVFTSGTTGVPKPVFAPLRSIASNVHALHTRLGITAADRLLQAAPVGFDPALVDVLLAHAAGATLVPLGAPAATISPAALARRIVETRATVLMCTPSFFLRLAPDDQLAVLRRPLRVLVLGGEAFPPLTTVRRWIAGGCRAALYNIYGTTECSAWATLQRVPSDDACAAGAIAHDGRFPIGDALNETVVEVRPAADGGADDVLELWIGGETRRCAVGDERDPDDVPLMRNTGDLVTVHDGRIYLRGRRDRQFKRRGKRAQLDEIEAVLRRELFDDAPVCVTFDRATELLRAFVAVDEAADIEQRLRPLLPPEHMPDVFWAMPRPLPTNANGKIDERALTTLADAGQLTRMWPRLAPAEVERARASRKGLEAHVLQQLASYLPGAAPSGRDYFVALGGDSMTAARFVGHLARTLDALMDDTATLNALLHEPLTAFAAHCFSLIASGATGKRAAAAWPEASSGTVRRRRADAAESERRRARAYSWQRQAVQTLAVRWAVDTGKCVDASPLVADVGTRRLIFVGSHSHRFLAVDTDDGAIVWEAHVRDRVESSAALCGDLVVFGCYDGRVHFLDAATGSERWVWTTGSQVKCSPTVDAQTGLVLIGSHDRHVYLLHPARQTLVRAVELDAAVFAEIAVDGARRCAFAATQHGTVSRLSLAAGREGERDWSATVGAPVFASPAVVHEAGAVCVATATGVVCALNVADGSARWTVRLGAPVFSSPCVLPDATVALGCHDGTLKVLRLTTGQTLGSFAAPGSTAPVYASPAALCDAETGLALVAAFHTDGQMLLLRRGAADGAWEVVPDAPRLPGEVFSSPVFASDASVVVGCRNDYVYMLQGQAG